MNDPGKPKSRQRLLEGACVRQELLHLDWRTHSGQTSYRNVKTFAEGIVFIEVTDIDGAGGCVWPTIEVSHDAQRWADRVTWRGLDVPGYYSIPVNNLSAYVRVSYRLVGRVEFSIEWVGKRFAIGRPIGVVPR